MRKHVDLKWNSLAATVLIAVFLVTGNTSPSLANEVTEQSTFERAGIRCIAVGAVAAFVTFALTYSPSTTAAVAAGACATAAGEEAIASELEKGISDNDSDTAEE